MLDIVKPTIGVLALQGDVREHFHALAACGAEPGCGPQPCWGGKAVPGGS